MKVYNSQQHGYNDIYISHVINIVITTISWKPEYCESCIWIDTYLRIQRELYLD